MKDRGRTFELLLTMAAVLATLVAAGCGGDDSSGDKAAGGDGGASKKLKIAWVGVDFTNPLYASIRKEALAEADKQGVELLTTGSNDGAQQINAMQTYIGQKVDALGVSALNTKPAAGVANQAVAAGIPVISVHSTLPGAKVTSAISIDFRGMGEVMGDQIVDYCKDLDPCKLGLFVGSRADDASVEVQEGVESKIGAASNIKVVANPANGFDPNQAASATTDVLTKVPDINAVWYVWSAGALAGIQAVKTAGKTGKVAVFSGSGVCPMLQADLKGTLNGDVMLFTQLEGKAFVQAAVAAARKQPVEAKQTVPTLGLTPDTAKAYLSGEEKPPAEYAKFVIPALKTAASGKCPKT